MAQAKTTRLIEFDSIVIGGGLSGLIIANQLESTGRKVALIEQLDVLGGNCRPFRSPVGLIDHGLKVFPDRTETHQALDWIEAVTGQTVERHSIEAQPLTYDNGRFQPFVGFGDQAPDAAGEIDYYTSPSRLVLTSSPKDWVLRLTESFTGSTFTQSMVTRFNTEDEFIIEILVNGTKRMSAREYVFCAPPQELGRLLPESFISQRNRQKLARGSYWTSVHLDLIHSGQVSDSEAIHVLRGANEDPCFGLFQSPAQMDGGQVCQHSQWAAFLPSDLTEDHETLATTLKRIKRQLKRAYSECLENILFERILVCPASHGETGLSLTAEQKWPKVDNLWVSSGFFSSEKNIVASLLQTQRVVEAMPEQAPIDLDDDAQATPSALSPQA